MYVTARASDTFVANMRCIGSVIFDSGRTKNIEVNYLFLVFASAVSSLYCTELLPRRKPDTEGLSCPPIRLRTPWFELSQSDSVLGAARHMSIGVHGGALLTRCSIGFSTVTRATYISTRRR
jgi:hypothetical protein